MKMKNLVIFDFDDTIVDNSTLDYMGFKIPCQKLGIDFPSKLKLKTYRKKGMTAKEIFNIFSNDNEITIKFLKLRKSFLKNKSSDYLIVKPFSSFVFKKLIKSNNELVICTVNNNPKMIRKFLKEKKLDQYFKKFFSIDNLGIFIENNNYSNRILIKTSLLRLIIKNSRNSNNDFLFIGNSLEDYYSAKKLKIKFIYLLNSYLPNPKINNLIKATKMNQIPDLIKGEKN